MFFETSIWKTSHITLQIPKKSLGMKTYCPPPLTQKEKDTEKNPRYSVSSNMSPRIFIGGCSGCSPTLALSLHRYRFIAASPCLYTYLAMYLSI